MAMASDGKQKGKQNKTKNKDWTGLDADFEDYVCVCACVVCAINEG